MKIYYDGDASIEHVRDSKIAVIGYGSQGRAQAMNLRDSGLHVQVGNIKDSYWDQAVTDGFEPVDIAEAAAGASIIFFLIPDQAQKQVFNELIVDHLQKHDLLIFAHGFSIYYKTLVPPEFIDVCLLAPRMPGIPIREHYLNGSGVPAFLDVNQNASGRAMDRLLGLAKAIGFTRAGVMAVSFKEETELDLFVEQFFLPVLFGTIRTSFDTLVEEGYQAMPALMELYASGELGEMMLLSARMGIYKVWAEQASPTCRYGMCRSSDRVIDKDAMKTQIKSVLGGIRNGDFVKDLQAEAESGYGKLKEHDRANEQSLLMETQRDLDKALKL